MALVQSIEHIWPRQQTGADAKVHIFDVNHLLVDSDYEEAIFNFLERMVGTDLISADSRGK